MPVHTLIQSHLFISANLPSQMTQLNVSATTSQDYTGEYTPNTLLYMCHCTGPQQLLAI